MRKCTDTISICGIFRSFKTYFHMAHCSQIINFIRLNFLNNADQVGRISKIAIMQFKMYVFFMRILVQMIDPVCIE